jgi:myo-inositol-1(or 4)-monophosphatase
MHPLVNIALLAAKDAGKFIYRHLEQVESLTVEKKGRSDFVTQVDKKAEQIIVQTIRKYYPDHDILGEEGGEQGGGQSDVRWIIDPLDGTTNFLHKIPHFAVSIGVEVRGQLEHGVVFNPCTDELYHASKGEGATLNNRRIRVSKTVHMEDAVIGTGFPIRKPDTLDTYLPMLTRVANESAGLRRAGAAALDLAYVASGRLDGYFELNLKAWDIAAGIVLVREAGGQVSEIYGDDKYLLDTGHVCAGNHKISGLLAESLRR